MIFFFFTILYVQWHDPESGVHSLKTRTQAIMWMEAFLLSEMESLKAFRGLKYSMRDPKQLWSGRIGNILG